MYEQRMLIDGKLVDAEGGKTFDNINPATEEVLGPVADGTGADMQRAVDAARTAFDTTDWSTDHAGRKAAILQLQAAIESEVEDLRSELVSEVGCPVLITYGPQLDVPLKEALRWPAEHDRHVRVVAGRWVRRTPSGTATSRSARSGRSRSASSA